MRLLLTMALGMLSINVSAQTLERYSGRVFRLVCVDKNRCGSAPIILRQVEPDRYEFEVNNLSIAEYYVKGGLRVSNQSDLLKESR